MPATMVIRRKKLLEPLWYSPPPALATLLLAKVLPSALTREGLS